MVLEMLFSPVKPLLVHLTILTSVISARAEDTVLPDKVTGFFKQYCVKCHGAEKQSAKLRLDGNPNLADKVIRKQWEQVWVKIASGEMPPKGEAVPTTAEMTPVLDSIREHTAAAELAARGDVSGNGLRRLTAREQARAWTDLLHLHYPNHVPDFQSHLAKDPSGEDFINRGDVLLTQEEHVHRSLDLAERMLALLIPDPTAPMPVSWTIKPSWVAKDAAQRKFYQELGGVGRPPALKRIAEDRQSEDVAAAMDVHAGCWPNEDESGLVLNPVYRTRSGLNGFDHVILRYPQPTTSGVLRLVIRARSELPRGETALPTLWLDSFLKPGNQLKLEGKATGELTYHTVWSLAQVTVPMKPTDLVIEVPLELTNIDFASFNSGADPGLWLMLRNMPVPNNMPVLPTREEKLKLREAGKYKLESQRPPKGTPGWCYYPNDIEDGPRIIIERIDIAIRSREPEKESRKLRVIGEGTAADLKAFAERAWGRAVTEAEMRPYLDLLSAQKKTQGEPTALRLALAAILVSPDSLYLSDRRADAARAATDLGKRLAITLWGRVPDDRLRDLAANGKLLDPAILRVEIARMIADERFSWFAEEFCRQWLGLEAIAEIKGSWSPPLDPSAYARNLAIRDALMAEPGHFLLDSIRRNRPVSHLVAPDRLILNAPLAAFYDVKQPIAAGWQPVSELPPNRRGGVLTMSGPIIVASREEKESQIYRGTYLLTRLFGVEVGTPPANVPTLQALNENLDIRKKTIREKLNIHLERTCAVCHNKIDPLGFAWEHFDPFGRISRTAKGDLKEADTAGKLPNGRAFQNLDSMCKEILADPKSRGSFPRAFTHAMTSYVLGRKLALRDEKRIDDLLGDGDPHLADLLTAIILNDQAAPKK